MAMTALACGGIPAGEGGLAAAVPEAGPARGELLARRVKPHVLRRKALACGQDATRLRAAFAEHRGKMDKPALDVVIPLMGRSDGEAMVEVRAEKAQRFEGPAPGSAKGKVKAARFVLCQGVVLRQFDREGAVSAEIRASECFIDLGTGSAWFEGTVNGTYAAGHPFTGDGIYFSSEDFFVKIYSSVEIAVAR